MLRRDLIGLIGLLALSGPALAEEPGVGEPAAVGEALDLLGFDAEDREKLLRDEIVSHGFEELSGKELAIIMAVIVPAPMSELLDFIRAGEVLEINRDVLAFRLLGDEMLGEDAFVDAAFTASESPEIRDLLQVKPGSRFNLSTAEMSRFAELRKRFPAKGCERDPRCFSAVMTAYRAILRDRLLAYRQGGLNGIAPYAREGGKTADPAEELRTAASATRLLRERLPKLYAAFVDYPRATQSSIEHEFRWMKMKVQDRSTFVLAHRIFHLQEGMAFAAERHFYVGQSYNSLQILVGLIAAGDRTIAFYMNRTSTDQVAGFMSGTKHAAGRKIMGKEIRKQFERILASLEGR